MIRVSGREIREKRRGSHPQDKENFPELKDISFQTKSIHWLPSVTGPFVILGTEKTTRVLNSAPETKRQWNDSFKIRKEYSFFSRILYTAKLPMKCLGQIMIFSDIRDIKIDFLKNAPYWRLFSTKMRGQTKKAIDMALENGKCNTGNKDKGISKLQMKH